MTRSWFQILGFVTVLGFSVGCGESGNTVAPPSASSVAPSVAKEIEEKEKKAAMGYDGSVQQVPGEEALHQGD
ncbi:hypothetical protein SH528x_006640 [Novipirellula sp. SH528]|uniref:hypothetical protein n=1 Tax=Novipirellula sp. SH528 TaxID=3454466 RepID=UPI003FA0A90B